jgi:hypothetical protein
MEGMILLQLFCSVGMTAGYQEHELSTSVFGISQSSVGILPAHARRTDARQRM